MHNQKHLNDYVSKMTYQGAQNTYNIFKVESTQMKDGIATNIKNTFVEFFNSGDYIKSGATKNAIDLSKVDYMDTTGLAAILVLNRLSTNNGAGSIYLVGCSEAVKRLMTISSLDAVFGVKDKITELE